ncbi:MAG: HNH endonuclease, partial [Clostridiales bacterium]|nr:HNH endonuclease [Clostridiales bacterium]
MYTMVCVLNKEGEPLMPTERHGKVRRMLNDGMAVVVRAKPFTIRLTYDTANHIQPAELGIDAGYENAGFSAVNDSKELIGGVLYLLTGQVERNKDRAMYRRQRRIRLRYREPRFDNRAKPEGWLAPSIQNKLDTHIRLIELVKSLVPIKQVTVEVANFDIQAVKNPGIEGEQYQQGEQYGYWNLREYILHRDNHECQNPDCKNKSKHPVLQIHHIGYWKGDYSDRPGNLITLCSKCHTTANHKQGRLLWRWEPKLKSFRPET